MAYVFHLPGDYSFEKSGHKGKIFTSKELTDKIEFQIIETEAGHENMIIQKECIFAYYILEGSGNFKINGVVEKCQTGDLAIISAGTPFTYSGKLKMFLVCAPWWFPEQEITV